MAQEKFMNLEALRYYDEKLKALVDAKDAAALKAANDYSDSLADNYDAAGTAQTKVDALANGAVKDNADAIAKLNGDVDTEGSVAKAVADAKALVDADVEAVDAKAGANAGEITTLKGRMDTAEGAIDAIEEDIGNVDDLETTNKELVKAINEVRNAVSAGGTAAAITMDTTTTTDGALKSYTIKQGDSVVGTIDIPKDMVVESGEVVTNPEGMAEGTYIKLVLANVADPLYINVGTLVDIYKAQANAAQVQVAIDSATREISATIVAGSVTSVELADNAVVTAKIADKNVTKAKLSAEVQASLDKADASAAQTSLDAEVERATAAEAKALSDAKAYADGLIATEKGRAEGVEGGLDTRLTAVEAQLGTGEGSVDEKIATAKQAAIDAAAADATSKANAAEANAKGHADGLNTAMDTRVKAVEDEAHTHANAAELDKIVEGDVAKWNAAQANAEATAAAALASAKTELEGKITDGDNANKELIDALDGRMDTAESDIDNLEASLAEGGATALAIADAKKVGTDAQADVDALAERVEANEGNISGHADRIAALEGKVGDGFVAITNAEIDTLFAVAE